MLNNANNQNGGRMQDMQDVTIIIKTAKNGVSVKVCQNMDDEMYVYESMDKALKEIPSLVSVTQQKMADSGKVKDDDGEGEGEY